MYRIGEVDGRPYIAYEYIDGVSLEHAAAPMPWRVALGGGCALAGAYTVMRPDRTRALILYGATDRMLRAPDHPHGIAPERFAAGLAAIQRAWGEPLFLERSAPSVAEDPAFRAWWGRYLRASASPGAAEAVLSHLASLDLRAVFPQLRAPTLLHRDGDQVADITGARRICDSIAGARLVELAGIDHLAFVGDTEA